MGIKTKFNLPYVVVFITAYNEEGSIANVIKGVQEAFVGGEGPDYILEVIVIDDGSKDKTVEIARQTGIKKIVTHPYNRGLGAATRTGLQTAYEMGADIAVKIDADAQFPPEEIENVVRPILEDGADCVFGSRFKDSPEYEAAFYRRWGNKFFAWLVSKITGLKITDAATGLMAFHRRYLEVFTIIKNYNETQQLMIDSWGKYMRIMEVPVRFYPRKTGNSFIKFGLKYPANVLPVMFRMYIHFKPLRFFLSVGFLFIILGVLAGINLFIGYGDPFFGDAAVAVCIIVGVQIIIFGLLADQISYKRK